MAISGSGLFVATFTSMLDNTGLSIDLTGNTTKAALFTSSITPDFTADVGYGTAPYDSGEVSGTGYTAGGATLTGGTVTGSSGVLTFDAPDVSWANSTLSGVRGVLIYDDSQTDKNGVVLVDLGQDYATSNGTLLIQWHSNGIFQIDLVP